MLNHRLQILVEQGQYERLAVIARSRGASIGELVRDAIDRTYPEVSDEKRRAALDILDAPPMSVPSMDDLKRELEDIRSGAK